MATKKLVVIVFAPSVKVLVKSPPTFTGLRDEAQSQMYLQNLQEALMEGLKKDLV